MSLVAKSDGCPDFSMGVLTFPIAKSDGCPDFCLRVMGVLTFSSWVS